MTRHPAPTDSSRLPPLVSIVIPVYNGSNYLREAIDSALAQDYPNCEVIVVNDGSTDGGATEAIALSYGGRVRYFHKENGGVASALNLGVAVMAGEYFSWLSHDDRYLPHKVSAQMEYLAAHPEPAVLYTDFEHVDGNGDCLGRQYKRGYDRDAMRRALLFEYPVHGCTTLIPRECFERVGLFDERLRTSQDYDFWFRAAKEYRFSHLPQPLVLSRVHDQQGTVTMSAVHIREANQYLLAGVRQLAAEEGGGPLLLGECAVDFRARGFAPAGAAAFAAFLRSCGPLRLCFDRGCRSLFFRYQLCLLRRLQVLMLRFLPVGGGR